jgi:YegS/Rv2252/BmrU family lipid kinase
LKSIEVAVVTAKHFVVIVNPHGGTRRGPAVLESVKPAFDAAGAKLDVHVSKHAGHVAEIAKSINTEDYDGVCVVGGDGTIHEAINGLMQQSQRTSTPLGFIPAGSGNSVLRHLNGLEPLEAVRRILAGHLQRLDVVRVTMSNQVMYSVNIVGWGSVVDISLTAERLRALGPSRYTVAALCHILRPKQRRAKLVLGGKTFEDQYVFVIACNTKFTGKGMQLAPDAELDDGKMDVVVVRPTSRWQMFKLMNKIYDGSHLALPCVEVHQVRSLSIETASRDCLNVDGELKGTTPITAEVMPGALRIFV